MAQNREIRIQQALLDLATLQNATIRSVAAANDVDFTTLSRRISGQAPRALAYQHRQLSFTAIRELAAIVSHSSGGHKKVGKNWITPLPTTAPRGSLKGR